MYDYTPWVIILKVIHDVVLLEIDLCNGRCLSVRAQVVPDLRKSNCPKHIIVEVQVSYFDSYDENAPDLSPTTITNLTDAKVLHRMTIVFIYVQDNKRHFVTIN